MLGFLLAGGGEGVVENVVSVTPATVVTPTATISAYNGLIEQLGIQWGTVALWALGIVFVLLLAYIVYNVVKGAKAKVKK